MHGSTTDTQTLDYKLHHGNHRQLLSAVSVSSVPGARVDAIVVPAARPVESLETALTLAQELGCGVVVLCSHDITAAQAAAAGDDARVPVIALDVCDKNYRLPTLRTGQVQADFARPSDTSKKRNLALVLAKIVGWERVLFLDDDIKGITPSGARAAAALTIRYDAVGLENKGYPDNSVVCHTYRDLEGDQAEFIGVGAMAIDARTNLSFFPNIYNEDWMFVLGLGFPPDLAVTGRMIQEPYDPFADPDCARREEFGDCLAEGLYWLLDEKKSIERADIGHWETFLKNRLCFIDHLVARVVASGRNRAWVLRALDSLGVARDTTAKITPESCVEFMECWEADLNTWQKFVGELPVDLGVEKALKQLGWPGVEQSDYPWPDIPDMAGDRLIFPNGRELPAADQQARRSPDRPAESPQLASASTYAGVTD